MSNFTDEQLTAVVKEGKNIIVSAGAGSGKTTVLTARVLRKIDEGIDINKLLVLTFTTEAAFNMKEKIRKELIENNLNDSLDYLDQAYITTFDSYALSIVKKYHYILNISPNISIIDSSVIDIKRKEFIDEIFDDMYGNPLFDDLISKFTNKDDALIKKYILNINKALDLKYDKDEYLDNYINDYYDSQHIDKLLNEYIEFLFHKRDAIANTLDEIASIDGNFASNLYILFDKFLKATTYEELSSIKDIQLPRATKGTKEVKEKLKKLKDSFESYTEYDLNTIKENIVSTRPYASVIVQIIKKLDSKLNDYKYNCGNYEFNDISKMAIKVVKENDEVREELKNYYNEIMVDEYQDTNDLQELFVSLIQNNNVYMVGDIKQSIYRFRNANPDIFRDKYNAYQNNDGGYKIDLLKNFRSREEVLNNINLIFDYIMDDKIGNAAYKESHRMESFNKDFKIKDNKQNYNLEILNYNYDREYKEEEIEAFIIANDIKSKIDNKYQILDKGVLRDFTYTDACIILDRGSAFNTYKKVFEYLGIPLVMYQDEKMNEEKDMYVIRNLINLIIKIHEGNLDTEFKYYFTSIARSYLFDYDDAYIFSLFKDNNFKDNDIYIKAYEISLKLDEITNEMLIKLVIKKFNLYENIIKVGDIKKSLVRIDYIIGLAQSLSKLGYTTYDLGKYLIDSMDTEIKYNVNDKMGNNVRIMNIHKSKGLEFNVCYYAGYYKGFNFQELNDPFLYSSKYGIITPYYKDGIDNTIVKELYKNEYYSKEISEKIRLLYVALTRAKEKMIIVAHLDSSVDEIGNMVADDDRIAYRSFLDIINSLKSKLLDYIKDIDYHNTLICHNYDYLKNVNYKNIINKRDITINKKSINITNSILSDSHFSKNSHKLYSKDEISKMDFGTYIHYLFEITDFYNPVIESEYKNKVLAFINKIDLKDSNIYKEYEFIYEDNKEIKHGVIDLMIEYPNRIDIYDYKLKNVDDTAYIKQLNGYKKYIESKTNKKVNTYLYSISDEKIRVID